MGVLVKGGAVSGLVFGRGRGGWKRGGGRNGGMGDGKAFVWFGGQI